MRYGFVIDQNRCIGCHACTVACKEEHNVPLGVFRTWVKYVEKGEYPQTRRYFAVLRCNHCDWAPCVEICPTVALYRRPDGIVDFDSDRCIGCKSCMQACPYDALYLDPNTHTAAKCNYCAHRVESGLEPACVIVCPEQAIIAGDLDDPRSKISRVVTTQKVSLRKAEKGTRPKLFYAGVEEDLLQPVMLQPETTYLWAEKKPDEDSLAFEKTTRPSPGAAREVYDVSHPAPWGARIAAYLWTKSIAAGVLLVATFLLAAGFAGEMTLLRVASPLLAMVFTGVTTLLLISDLKRPERFYYLLVKPNLRSWLVWGGYILILYGVLSFLWLLFGLGGNAAPLWMASLAAMLAICSAGYSAFLFAQAKGRDLWQSRLFLWHLLTHATAAGSAALIVAGAFLLSAANVMLALRAILAGSLLLNLAMILSELFLPHVNEPVRRATDLLKRGPLSRVFWVAVVLLGTVVPLILLFAFAPSYLTFIGASAFALMGLWVFEDLWVKAGQAIPLS
ncbi:MAG: polysulfide reductase NrfD [Deltaproteobacteria bacterium]|nr:polysulfide reductase NrfD [Deltaproteobacteria bacterium]